MPFTVANAAFVTERVAVGGDLETHDPQRAGQQLAELVAAGITHIVDLRAEWSDQVFVARRAPQVRFWQHRVEDAGQRIGRDWFDQLLWWVDDALAGLDAKVLLHCHMGINRGPSAGYAVLLDQGWDPVEALTAIRTARPVAAIDYAEDALLAHHQRRQVGIRQRRQDRARVARWRAENPLDVVRVTRDLRAREVTGPASRGAHLLILNAAELADLAARGDVVWLRVDEREPVRAGEAILLWRRDVEPGLVGLGYVMVDPETIWTQQEQRVRSVPVELLRLSEQPLVPATVVAQAGLCPGHGCQRLEVTQLASLAPYLALASVSTVS